MCGILLTTDPGISAEAFKRALLLMNHRGPDAQGYEAIDGIQFGHNRLKILDLDNRSNQPFHSKDGRYVIVYNGEVYNYRELAARHGIQLRTTCDTELILELYALKGVSAFNEFNGMFAFVIYDTKTRDVVVVRDRLGVKPIYMARKNGHVYLASEPGPILELAGPFPFDEEGVRQYRKLRTFFNNRTIYSGIESFPAGCYMLNGKVERYWSLSFEDKPEPSDDELGSLVRTAVNYRCISDVPVGSYLSGGLDSTIVAGLAHKPHTWTVGFADNNEFDYARIAAERFKSVHHEVLVTPDQFVETTAKMVRWRREPLAVPNEVLLYEMTRAVKKENTVVLSGEGADELFYGYDRIFAWAKQAKTFDLAQFAGLYCYGSNSDLEIVESAVAPFMQWKSPLKIVAAFFQIAHLHGLLRRLDSSTMFCAVEARVPFVDYRLVERMAGVSYEYRNAQNVIKAPLKRVFADLVPKPIIERPKVGFPVPLNSMPFPGHVQGATGMDKWLVYNLQLLGAAEGRFAGDKP